MKKVVVFSDSHGIVRDMADIVKKEKPDKVIHLGDCERDAQRLLMECPGISLESIPGNCDSQNEIEERVINYAGFRILLCHGHTYWVKMGYLRLALAAEEKGVDIALFGHTHNVCQEQSGPVILFNPGSIGSPPPGVFASYGILMLDESTKKIETKVKYWSGGV